MTSLPFLQSPEHRRVLEILSIGGEGRFVGSAVRDSLLGGAISDFDVATTHHPDVVCKLFGPYAQHVVKTGIAYGTVTIHMGGHVYEVTTLREDTACDGRHAHVQFTQSWEKDAARRDFTFNALYVDVGGTLYDYYGGVQDLRDGVVRFIGDPEQRIVEDYLRILRFFRFAARYGHGRFDDAGLKACLAYKDDLRRLSRERVAAELSKLMTGPLLDRVVSLWTEEGFWQLLGGCVPQSPERWFSLFDLTKASGLQADFLTQMHALYGCVMPSFILPRADQTFYKLLLKPIPPFKDEDDLLILWPTILSEGSFDVLWARLWLTLSDLEQWSLDMRAGCLKRIKADGARTPLPFPISGEDVMALGISGALVGQIIVKARSFWQSSRGSVSKDDLLAYIREGL